MRLLIWQGGYQKAWIKRKKKGLVLKNDKKGKAKQDEVIYLNAKNLDILDQNVQG